MLAAFESFSLSCLLYFNCPLYVYLLSFCSGYFLNKQLNSVIEILNISFAHGIIANPDVVDSALEILCFSIGAETYFYTCLAVKI